MEFYMVWNTSTTNDFPNVSRGLKIKILASNIFLWREWLSFSPALGIFAPPKVHHSPFLPNSIEKMTQSYLQGSGRWKLHNGSCYLLSNWKEISHSNILVRNHTSNFFGSQKTSRKGSLWFVNEKYSPSIWESHHLLTFLWVFGVWKSPWSSPGGFPSFSLRRETQFYCGHQCTQLSTRISLVYLLSIFEMSAIIFNSETTYFLIIRVRTAGL